MAKVIDYGTARPKLEALFEKLRERIPEEALMPTMAAIASDAAQRAPTPQQEYQTMMYGGWSAAGFQTTSFSARGAVTDSDGRVRFYKPSDYYLKAVIPASFGVDGLLGWAGDYALLAEASAYTYVNYTKRDNKDYRHEVKYPFWQAWENGGSFIITPAYYSGNRYPLSPAPNVKTFRMTKMFPDRRMYRGVAMQRFIDGVFIPNLRKITTSI